MTAQDYLYQLLAYRHGWADRTLAQSKPALLRVAQLEALQAAFGLQKPAATALGAHGVDRHARAYQLNALSSLDYVVRGEFLRDRPEDLYHSLIERARAAVCAAFDLSPDDRLVRRPHLSWLFNYLLHYRQSLYDVSQRELGMLEGFALGLHYGQLLANQVKGVIQANTHELDAVLWELLDPARQDIPLVELSQRYGYRDLDFEAIDLAWRMEDPDRY
jgi:hypothetical protein